MEQLVFELGLAVLLMATAAFFAGRLKLSVVPFIILIGLVVGPHIPNFGLFDLRFIESRPTIDFMGRLGVLFLLFYVGLEFSVARLIRAGGSIATSGAIYIAINLTLGLFFGWAVGLPVREILVVAGITTVSSSAIVAKVIVELRRSARPETGLILGIIMFEDVFLAAYIAVVSGFVLHGSTSLSGVAVSFLTTAIFVAVLILSGRYAAPYINRWLRAHSDETFLLSIFAILFLVAGISETMGVAEAIGALLIGLALAETEHADRITRIVVPFRDFFGAFLFFSFGLSIDPLALGGAVGLALIAVALTITGNFVAGVVAGRLAGLPARGGVTIGLTIVSRGEFSIVLASLAQAGGLLSIINPFTAAYVLCLSILGPILTKFSDDVYELLEMTRIFVKAKLTRSDDEVKLPGAGEKDSRGGKVQEGPYDDSND